MRHLQTSRASRRIACVLLLGAATGIRAQSATAIPKLDLDRFTGAWYEIARIPVKPEKRCVSDAMVLYSLGDKKRSLQMVISCKLKDGNTDSWNPHLKTDKALDGKLRITYIWPPAARYWVLATGPEYEWALVGSPSHKWLWILSKTIDLPPNTLADVKARAAAQGFKTDKLVAMPHHP